MSKGLKVLLTVLGVSLVLVLAFMVGGKEGVKSIDSDKYNKISSSKGFVYYGPKKDMDLIKNIADETDLTINFLDSDNNSVKNLKTGTLYRYKDGKEVYSYSGDFESYKFYQDLMKNNIMKRTYLEVNAKDYLEIMKSSGYNFMFIGSSTCGYCTQFKDSINEALKDYDFNVYYIDLASLTEDEYNSIVSSDSYMSENEWGTPLNLLYKDGKRVNVLNGYVPADELVKFLKENKVI